MEKIEERWAAFLLVEILYEKELVNEETYISIKKLMHENQSDSDE